MKNNKQLSVFVVEDNLLFQQLIAKQLEAISHSIYFFTSGEGCLVALGEQRPDVIILDNNLEGQLTGLETLQKLRQAKDDVYVVLFSTEPGLNSNDNLSRYGAFEYVEKNEAGFRQLKDTVRSSDVYQLKANIL